MSSEDTNQYGLNISILHGFSFGTGAMAVLLILGLCFLWLKCKRKPQNSASCLSCPHGPLAQLPPPRPPSLAIEMMEPSTSSLQPLSIPRGRMKDEEEIIRDFLQFSKSQAQVSPSAPETNPYMLR